MLTIRPLQKEEMPFLREMLYQCLYVPPGMPAFARAILNQPEIAKYISDWGQAGDLALIAEDAGRPIGAVWMRLFSPEDPGYGFVDAHTPEISMAVLPEYRGAGVGSQLLSGILQVARQAGFAALSLSVDPNNAAVRLYQRHGFVQVGVSGTSITMKADIL